MNVLCLAQSSAALLALLVGLRGITAVDQGNVIGCFAIVVCPLVWFYLARQFCARREIALFLVAGAIIVNVVFAPSVIIPAAIKIYSLMDQCIIVATFLAGLLLCGWHAHWATQHLVKGELPR